MARLNTEGMWEGQIVAHLKGEKVGISASRQAKT
jgi:hypothetical protein